jgi:hypothetical protein
VNINRHNYEPFLIICIEGVASAEVVREVEDFLAENPDIAAEFEAMKSFGTPHTDMIGAPDFSFLKQPEHPEQLFDSTLLEQLSHPEDKSLPPLDLGRLKALYPESERDLALLTRARVMPGTETNPQKPARAIPEDAPLRDAMLVAGAEGDWSNTERIAFFKKATETDKAMLSGLKKLKLQPDGAVVFADKAVLYQTPVVAIWHQRTTIRAAAAVALLLVSVLLLFNNENPTGQAGLIAEIGRDELLIPVNSDAVSAALVNDVAEPKKVGSFAPPKETGPKQSNDAEVLTLMAFRNEMPVNRISSSPVGFDPVAVVWNFEEENPEVAPAVLPVKSWDQLAARGVEDLLRLERQPDQSLTAAIFNKATSKLNESDNVRLRIPRGTDGGQSAGWRIRIGQVAIAKRDR